MISWWAGVVSENNTLAHLALACSQRGSAFLVSLPVACSDCCSSCSVCPDIEQRSPTFVTGCHKRYASALKMRTARVNSNCNGCFPAYWSRVLKESWFVETLLLNILEGEELGAGQDWLWRLCVGPRPEWNIKLSLWQESGAVSSPVAALFLPCEDMIGMILLSDISKRHIFFIPFP